MAGLNADRLRRVAGRNGISNGVGQQQGRACVIALFREPVLSAHHGAQALHSPRRRRQSCDVERQWQRAIFPDPAGPRAARRETHRRRGPRWSVTQLRMPDPGSVPRHRIPTDSTFGRSALLAENALPSRLRRKSRGVLQSLLFVVSFYPRPADGLGPRPAARPGKGGTALAQLPRSRCSFGVIIYTRR